MGEECASGGETPVCAAKAMRGLEGVDLLGPPSRNYELVPTQPRGSYEGGKALASPSRFAPGDAVQPMFLAEGARKQLQSLHEAQPSSSKERIHLDHEDGVGLIGPSFSPADLAKTGPEPCPRQGKKDAPESLVTGSLGDHGSFLLQQLLEVLPLRSQPKGRTDSRSLFPLPSSRSLLEFAFPDLSEREMDWLRCVVISLNSLWGGDLDSEKAISSAQKACLSGLTRDVSRFCALDVALDDFSWDEFFKVKSVDYRGEEVKVACWFSWNNIAPALPREIGTVPLADVCELGCKFYVENFEAYLKPRHEWQVTKPPRVMVSDDDWGPVCTGLVQSGICCFLEDCDVFHVGTEPLLNGLFGVSKDETSPKGFEVFRLIMNLIPLNNLCRPFSGDVDTLPSWGSMSPYFLQPSERLLVSSEDVKCFFYTMSVPAA